MIKDNPNSTEMLQKVENLAREVVAREGCDFYDVEFTSHAGQRVLRLYIDKTPGPVGVDDCANVSRGLSLMLDVEDVIPGGAFNLEVSSPGLERTLKRKEHFARAVGQKVWIKIERALQTYGVNDKQLAIAKQLNGRLLEAVPEKGIRIVIEEKRLEPLEVELPWDAIEKAKLVFELEKGNKNPHHRGN